MGRPRWNLPPKGPSGRAARRGAEAVRHDLYGDGPDRLRRADRGWTGTAERLLGWTAAEILGRPPGTC
ncbi:hypothetical protein NKH77_09340 [Streptomyces sp. M19]